MIQCLLLCAAIILFLFGIYKWLTVNDNFFEKRGVPYVKPEFLFGNTKIFLFQTMSLPDFSDQMYAKFPTKKIFGLFDFQKPSYFIRDPEIVKLVTIKDFDHFMDHRSFSDESVDPLFGNTLMMLKGEKWRQMRSTLSPAFTGSKMRQMCELIAECANEMADYFKKESQRNENKAVDCEMKELFSKYTNDVISTAAYGIKINSFKDPNNEFFQAGRKFKELESPKVIFRLLLMKALPSVAKMFDITFFDSTTRNFFRSMVLNNIATREKEGIFRPDMINILMNVRNGVNLESGGEEKQSDGFAAVDEQSIDKTVVNRVWTDDEIVSQCFFFFLGGFDTTSTCLSFVSHELAIHPDYQEKLYQEVCETQKQLDGKSLTYEAIQKMKYMDMVISESLRLWPPLILAERQCVKDYDYDDGDIKVKIEKGTDIWIPIHSFHHDEKYFPEPGTFDPERFSDENKGNIIPGSYLPFGSGSRNCIGSRFALMVVKTMLYYLLLDFKFEPNSKTQIPLKLKRTPITLISEKGIHLQLKLRK